MKLISIVIPVFNAARFIRDAVESCLSGVCPSDVEVIVVDDGSTDATPEVLASYRGHPAVRVLRQDNAGPAAARNRGIHASEALFVAFLDSDDVYLPGTLSKFLETVAVGEGGASLFFCDYLRADSDGNHTGMVRVRHALSGPALFQQFLLPKALPVLTSTVLVERRALVELSGFDERFLRCEDLELFTRMVGSYSMQKLDLCSTVRRSHGAQLTGQRREIIHWREECNIAFLRRTPFEKFCGRSDKIGLATAAEAFGDIMLRAKEPLPRTARYLYEMAQRMSPDARLRGKIEAARALL